MSIFEYDEEATRKEIEQNSYEQGLEQGIEQGMEQGIEITKMIFKLSNQGDTISTIAVQVGMTEEEVKKVLE